MGEGSGGGTCGGYGVRSGGVTSIFNENGDNDCGFVTVATITIS